MKFCHRNIMFIKNCRFVALPWPAATKRSIQKTMVRIIGNKSIDYDNQPQPVTKREMQDTLCREPKRWRTADRVGTITSWTGSSLYRVMPHSRFSLRESH